MGNTGGAPEHRARARNALGSSRTPRGERVRDELACRAGVAERKFVPAILVWKA